MLELRNVSIDVEDHKAILKNVDLTIEDGKFVVITGPNGGGKSTLAKVIAGIMTPSKGQLLLDGEDITALSVTERARRGITFAFQQPVRFKGLTVRDLLVLAAGEGTGEPGLRALLRDVGLCPKDYIEREINASLSGGEIKRIEIAMALARKTRITLFDEPEAGIDLWSFGNLIEVFGRLRGRREGTVIIISHQERILDIADELVVLAGGELRAKGAKEDILPELLQEGACSFCPEGARKGRDC